MSPTREPAPQGDDGTADPLPAELEDRVRGLVEVYASRLQAGERLDLYEFLATHAALAAHLGPRLEVIEGLYRLVQEPSLPAEGNAPRETPLPACIGRYRIQAVLGRGASSVVYRAYDPDCDRVVALKVIHERTPDREQAERFERDARALARLRHPNIVPLHTTGAYGDLCYLDMELIEGETLEERLRPTPWDFRETAELVRRLALALDWAHQKGVIHRDVKPSNILLDADGEPQLTDFGLARDLGDERSLTAFGAILGTPAYMSPEQADGRGREADARSDVYGLGVILYRLLTGRLPFDAAGSLSTLLLKIVKEEPPAPRAVSPAVPRDLETICLRALEKRPTDRFESARALADELWRWLHDEALSIRPPGLWERLRRRARRNPPAALFAVLAVGLLLTAGGVFADRAWVKHQHDYEVAVRTRLEGENAVLQDRLYIETEKMLLRAAWQRVHTPSADRHVDVRRLVRDAADLRRKVSGRNGLEAFRLDARSLFAATSGVPDARYACEAQLPGTPFALWPLAMHPDGREIVLATPNGPRWWACGESLRIPDAQKPQPHERPPLLAYSPNGEFLAIAYSNGRLELWDAPSRKLARTLGSAAPVLALAFGPQAEALWVCRAAGRVESWSLPDMEEHQSWKVPARPGRNHTAATFSAAGSLLAVGDDGGQVLLYEKGGTLRRTIAVAYSPVEALAWSPDTKQLAIGNRDGGIRLIDREGRPLRQFAAFSTGVGQLHFTPDGRWLFGGQRGAPGCVWDAATGALALTTHYVPMGFSRDGQRYAGTDTVRVAFVDFLAPEVVRPLSGHRAQVEWVAWSRDGCRLATLDRAFEVCVWDMPHGRCAATFPVPHGSYWSTNAALALSDDGRWLAYASGGDPASVLLRDLKAEREYGPWSLPRGFDRLAYAAGRFLSVREEEDPEQNGKIQTVARELTSHGPGQPKLVRPAIPGELRFFNAGLTADGRYYWWGGPREPARNGRVEVREVASGRLIRVARFPQDEQVHDLAGMVTPDGRHWLAGHPGSFYLRELNGTGKPIRRQHSPIAISADSRWGAYRLNPAPGGHRSRLSLNPFPEGRTWLAFETGDPVTEMACVFSHDGRRLAWAGPNGTVMVADLDALRTQLAAFEQALDLP